MKKINEIGDEIAELEKYAFLEGSEIGETLRVLIVAAHNYTYQSDEFNAALTKEILEYLEYMKENTEIAESESVITEKFKYLKWNDE